MSVRNIVLASVCTAFLAASAAVPGAAAATTDSKLVSQAYRALQVGDAAAAVEAYTKAIESRTLEPEVLANALLNRGLSFQRLNEHERAIEDYTAAMRIDAMSGKLRALALYNRGLSFQRLQRNAQAMEDFTSALFLDSKFSHAYYSRGSLLRDSGQYLFALADFDKAIRFNYPEPARVHLAEAIAYEKLRRPAEARDALNKALVARPDYEPAKQRLATLDGKLTPRIQDAQADQIQTSAVTLAEKTLPPAQAPSAELLADRSGTTVKAPGGGAPAKKFVDRIPAETSVAAKIIPAAAPASEGKKIVAIDEVAMASLAAKKAPDAKAANVSEAPAAEPAAAEITGWTVQVASASSEDAAWSTWKRMKARHKVLAAKDPVVVRADLGSKGIFYRVRLIGFDNQADAKSECSRLKSKGVSCYISKAES